MLKLCRLCEHIKTSCWSRRDKTPVGGFFNGFVAHTTHTIHKQTLSQRNPQPNNSVEWCRSWCDAMRRSSGPTDKRFGRTDVYYFKCDAEYCVRTHTHTHTLMTTRYVATKRVAKTRSRRSECLCSTQRADHRASVCVYGSMIMMQQQQHQHGHTHKNKFAQGG